MPPERRSDVFRPFFRLDESEWLEALGILLTDLDPFHKIHEAGNSDKRNVVVSVNYSALDSIKPNLERVAELNARTGTNGLIVAAFDSPRAIADFRFFAPKKGILEDNAGSFTLASLCGYRAAYMAGGVYRWTVAQGFAMGVALLAIALQQFFNVAYVIVGKELAKFSR